MTSITRNLPWFIKDLGVSIVGKKCYTSLVEDLNLQDVDCLKYSLSKGLGLGIVVGGSIMKVPQLLIILSSKSARGLSLSAYVLETLAYAITLAYSYRNGFPFSTYGENFFLTIQNIIITLLIVYYPTSHLTRQPSTVPKVALTSALTGLGGLALYFTPTPSLSALQLATIPLSLFSKLPQIRQNHRARSTGQLSAFAVISQVAGCLARLFTTAAEVGDPILSAGFALALALNVILGVQMWSYWGNDGKEAIAVPIGSDMEYREKEEIPAAAWQHDGKVEVVIPPTTPIRASTPSRLSQSSTSTRRWSRKID